MKKKIVVSPPPIPFDVTKYSWDISDNANALRLENNTKCFYATVVLSFWE